MLKYVVFDAPSAGGKFEERMSVLHDLLTPGRCALPRPTFRHRAVDWTIFVNDWRKSKVWGAKA